MSETYADKARVKTDPRIRRRRRAVERAKRRRALGWGIAAAIVALIVYGAFFSPLLNVNEIQVLGSRHVTPDDIARAAGLDRDDNLLTTSTAEVARRVTVLPWVKSAKVSRRLPGTIAVRVQERDPALVLKTTGGSATIDARGRVLDDRAIKGRLPSLTGIALPAPAPGDRLAAREIRSALRVWRSLPGRLKADVDAIFAPTIERITLALRNGTLVRYGAPEDVRAKNSVLGALLPRSQGAAYLDVRVPTSPAVGPGVPTPGATPAY